MEVDDEKQVAVGKLPQSLIRRVDELATKDRRSRINMIEVLLEEAVARRLSETR